MSKANQIELPLKVVARKSFEEQGIDFGILADGRAYLSARGVAAICGIAASTFITHAKNWREGNRTSPLARSLLERGFDRPKLHVQTDGREHAYVEDVVMLILEHYAFEGQGQNTEARDNYRTMARAGIRAFVYQAIGYTPTGQHVPPDFQKFHDRLTLNRVPPGYFSVFREMSDMTLNAMQEGLTVDEHTIPDISVGKAWSHHWETNALEGQYGARAKHPHTYPDYFPQSLANESIEAWTYPLAALGDFRIWLENTYIPTKLPKYLSDKVKQGRLPPGEDKLIAEKLKPKQLPAKTK